MRNLDFKSMLIGFLLCAVAFLTIGATDTSLGKGVSIRDGFLYVEKGIVIENPNNPSFLMLNPNGMVMDHPDHLFEANPAGIKLEYKKNSQELVMTPMYIEMGLNEKKSFSLLTGDDGTSILELYNKFGNKTSSLSVTENYDGGIFLYDRYGDLGKSVIGKR